MSATRYQAVFVDFDHTIFDSVESERLAFAETMQNAGIEVTADRFAQYQQINGELWRSVERGERTPDQVNVARFAYFVSTIGVDADPQALSDAFPSGLARHGELYPGVGEVLAKLAAAVPLVMVTNGISEVQRARIERLNLDQYFQDYVISGEVDVGKPDPSIFAMALDKLDALRANQVLMVGDSYTADVVGAHAAGIDIAWLTTEVEDKALNPAPTYTISVIDQVVPIVFGT